MTSSPALLEDEIDTRRRKRSLFCTLCPSQRVQTPAQSRTGIATLPQKLREPERFHSDLFAPRSGVPQLQHRATPAAHLPLSVPAERARAASPWENDLSSCDPSEQHLLPYSIKGPQVSLPSSGCPLPTSPLRMLGFCPRGTAAPHKGVSGWGIP